MQPWADDQIEKQKMRNYIGIALTKLPLQFKIKSTASSLSLFQKNPLNFSNQITKSNQYLTHLLFLLLYLQNASSKKKLRQESQKPLETIYICHKIIMSFSIFFFVLYFFSKKTQMILSSTRKHSWAKKTHYISLFLYLQGDSNIKLNDSISQE